MSLNLTLDESLMLVGALTTLLTFVLSFSPRG